MESQKDPNWTDGELTLLRNNCKNNLAVILSNPEEVMILIDETTGEISINGEKNLQENFYMFPSCYGTDKKSRLYHQVKQALEEAKNRGIYDEIFKEVKE